jgi:hypothetical protein
MRAVSLEIKSNEEDIIGYVRINYKKFDGIQINTSVINSNDLVEFVEYNGNSIKTFARLYIPREEIIDNEVRFRARVNKNRNVKFRVALIQEHKEIESDTKFIEV